jgi:hypothetical protein
MTFLAKLKPDGTLDFGSSFNESRFRDFAQKNEGKYVKIEKPIPIRTLTQNSFYWAWLTKCEMETGNEKDQLHLYLKSKFLPKKIVKIKGKQTFHELQVDGSTKDLTKPEFGEYLDKCSAHTGIPLPTEEEIAEMGYLKS